MSDWFFGWEGRFLLYLQEGIRNPILDKIMQFITSLGDAGFIAIAACIVLLCVKKYRKVGLTAALSLVLDFTVVNLLLKNLFARTRPYVLLEELLLITKEPSDYSFPSGHSGACFAVASVMFLCLPRKIGIPAMLTAALIAFSRLYVGVHFPTDVLGGILIGCLTGLAAKKIVWKKKIIPEKKEDAGN